MKFEKLRISLSEYSSIIQDISKKEVDILSSSFKDYIEVISVGNGKCTITAKQFVGNIVLPDHIIVISPKINYLNLSYMLSHVYDIDPFRKEDLLYEEEREKIIFEQILRNFLNRIEYLCRKGILKSYRDKE